MSRTPKFSVSGEEFIDNLIEENKKLKECNKSQSEVINNVFIPQRERLEEENRKLKEELEVWQDTVKTQNEYNKFRIQENAMLKKENEQLREYKSMYEGLCK